MLSTAGVLLALATIFGAFGAHALKAQLSAQDLAVYDTAVRYHFFHALGLLGIGLAARGNEARGLRWAGMFVVAGVLLFSGSLYALSFGAPRLLGIVTPIGGLCFIVGWISFAITVARR